MMVPLLLGQRKGNHDNLFAWTRRKKRPTRSRESLDFSTAKGPREQPQALSLMKCRYCAFTYNPRSARTRERPLAGRLAWLPRDGTTCSLYHGGGAVQSRRRQVQLIGDLIARRR